MNIFDLRIDNRSFEYLLKKKRMMDLEGKKPEVEKKASKYEKNEIDPFSDFSAVAQVPPTSTQGDDPFGNFEDF